MYILLYMCITSILYKIIYIYLFNTNTITKLFDQVGYFLGGGVFSKSFVQHVYARLRSRCFKSMNICCQFI